jgi:hypothetical protein
VSCQHLAQPPSWKTAHCWLSATAYSIYLQLPSKLETVPPSAIWVRTMSWWQGPTYNGHIYVSELIIWITSRQNSSVSLLAKLQTKKHEVDQMTFTIHFHPQLNVRMCPAIPPIFPDVHMRWCLIRCRGVLLQGHVTLPKQHTVEKKFWRNEGKVRYIFNLGLIFTSRDTAVCIDSLV